MTPDEKRPPWLDPGPTPGRNFAIGAMVLALVFVAGFLLTRKNPNAGLFLLVAVIFAGLAFVSLVVAAMQRWGGTAVTRTGRSERELLVTALLVISVATPWAVEVKMAHAPQVFGWQSPVAWLLALATIFSLQGRFRRYRAPALVLAGVALASWALWLSLRLTTSDFSSLDFTFLPSDVVGEGWYLGLLAWVITVEGVAAAAADAEIRVRVTALGAFSIVPGLGLVRLGRKARGRVWLAVAAFTVFLIYSGAVDPLEFADYAAHNGMPPPRPRASGVLTLLLLGGLWLASLIDTWRTARLERQLA